LTRHEQGMVPTPAGAVLAAKARIILRDVGSLIAEARETSSEDQPLHLRVVCPSGMSPLVNALAVGTLVARFPDLTLDLNFHDDPLAMLDDADLVIFFGPVERTGAWRSLELGRGQLQLRASAAYLAEHGTPASVKELQGHRLALWQEPGSDATTVPLLDGSSVAVKPFLTTTDSFLLHQLAGEGHCIVLVPHHPSFDGDGVAPRQTVLPDVVGRVVEAHLAMSIALSRQPRIRAIVDELVNSLGLRESVFESAAPTQA
jgi:DNA-binding transcriptional LysR family regulator